MKKEFKTSKELVDFLHKKDLIVLERKWKKFYLDNWEIVICNF